jgi:hypothetical protein
MESRMYNQVLCGLKRYSLFSRLVPQSLIKIRNQKFDPLSTIIVLKGFPLGFIEQVSFSFNFYGNGSIEFSKKSISFKQSAKLIDTEIDDKKADPKLKMMIYEQFIINQQLIERKGLQAIIVENKLYSHYFPKIEITGLDLNGVYLEEKIINEVPIVKYSEKIKALKEFDLFDVYEESNGVPNLDDEDYDGIYFKANDYRDYLKSNNKITIRDINEWYKFRLDTFIGGFNEFNDNDVLALCINVELLQNQNFRQEMAALQVLAEANDLELYVFIEENKIENILVSPPKPFTNHPEHILAIKLGGDSSENYNLLFDESQLQYSYWANPKFEKMDSGDLVFFIKNFPVKKLLIARIDHVVARQENINFDGEYSWFVDDYEIKRKAKKKHKSFYSFTVEHIVNIDKYPEFGNVNLFWSFGSRGYNRMDALDLKYSKNSQKGDRTFKLLSILLNVLLDNKITLYSGLLQNEIIKF